MGRMLTTTRHNLILRSRASSTLFFGIFRIIIGHRRILLLQSKTLEPT